MRVGCLGECGRGDEDAGADVWVAESGEGGRCGVESAV